MPLNSILVLGAGIAGLSSAIALARQGFAVEVAEMQPDVGTLGTGLTLTAATLRALHRLGVWPAVAAAGHFSKGIRIHDMRGELLFERPGLQLADVDLPTGGGILRPALHGILHAEAVRRGVTMATGVQATSFVNAESFVEVVFKDGTRRRHDLVVGGDGLYSLARRALFPDAPEPRFTGQGCWRLLAARPEAVDRPAFYTGGRVTVGTVPVSATQMYVWVLEHVPDNPHRDPAVQPQLLRDLLQDFGGVLAGVRENIGSDSNVVYRPLEALLVDGPWHQGRIVLVGDAVHATTPHLASGAGMGIEDALVLAEELARHAVPEQALRAFSARRLERCRLVVENSLRIGRMEMEHQPFREIAGVMNASHERLAQAY